MNIGPQLNNMFTVDYYNKVKLSLETLSPLIRSTQK